MKDLSGRKFLKLPHCADSPCNTCEIRFENVFYILYFHAPFSSYYTCWNRSKNRNIWKVFLIMSLKHILFLYFSICRIFTLSRRNFVKSTLSLIVNTCEYFLNTYRPPRTIEEILLFSSSIPEKRKERNFVGKTIFNCLLKVCTNLFH